MSDSSHLDDTKRIIKDVCDIIADKKGEGITVLDVRDVASFTSFLVICGGRNQKQIQAICDALEMKLKKEHRLPPHHIEGYQEGNWVLIDCLDFVVHIFAPEARGFYSIEKLWGDGIRVEPQALIA